MLLRCKNLLGRRIETCPWVVMGVLWPIELLRLVIDHMHGRPGAGGGPPLV